MMATYNDWRSIAELLPELELQISTLGARAIVVIVDDGSADVNGHDEFSGQSFEAIEKIHKITLNQNFGNQRSVAIGLSFVAKNLTSDYLVIMDSDHEDKPEDIPRLLEACAEGGNREIVFAERRQRPEGFAFKVMYAIYKGLFRLLTGIHMSMGNFSVIPSALILRAAHMGDIWMHFPAGIVRSQFPIQKIPTDKGHRRYGASKMNFVNLILHAFGGFGVFADRVSIRILIGMLWCGVFFITALAYVLWQKYVADVSVIGWSSQIIVVLFAIMMQIIIGTVLLILVIFSRKTQAPLIPIEIFSSFVFEVTQLYPSQRTEKA